MKRIWSMLLAVVILCLCLTACVKQPMEENIPERETDTAGTYDHPEETYTDAPETEPASPSFTLPEMEMPTKPEQDYNLPPGEKGQSDVITE